MQVVIQGLYLSSGTKTNQKTGEVSPYAVLYSGEDSVKVSNLDCTGFTFGSPVEVVCDLFIFDDKPYFKATGKPTLPTERGV